MSLNCKDHQLLCYRWVALSILILSGQLFVVVSLYYSLSSEVLHYCLTAFCDSSTLTHSVSSYCTLYISAHVTSCCYCFLRSDKQEQTKQYTTLRPAPMQLQTIASTINTHVS